MTDNITPTKGELVDEAPSNADVLEESEAKLRSKEISNVRYDFSLSLEKESPTYDGNITIRFTKTGTSPTFLDFVGKKITKLKINNQDMLSRSGIFKSNRLHLPQDVLAAENVIEIQYTNEFNHGGVGFHQFEDQIDHQKYYFTHFEPFDAHKLFPCFDQPDIKARYKVSITAPSDWEIIANNPASKAKADDGRTIHSCPETAPFSTYIFAIVAGPYDSFQDKVVVRGKEIPLRILCRKSLIQFLKPDLDELFTITKQGMEWYTNFFNYPYPFEKYDQIFVPEFNMGAMENVGAVTFTESYVFREPQTESRHCGRADTVLHEMAHMWFGNLVSPVWWDGLWLNESFATYMAAFAVSKCTHFGEISWQEFNGTKKWGEREDQLSTTHPIQGIVKNTDETFLNFDGITYAKGAASIKQLVALITEDGLREGMRHYFKKHEFGNTTIVDFLKALQVGYDAVRKQGEESVDLLDWAKLWLETAGLNAIEPSYKVGSNGKIEEFSIIQSAPADHPTLRPHKIELAFFKLDNGVPKLVESKFVLVKPQAETPLPQLVGMDAPDFVFSNFNDHAFAKTFLDKKSLDVVLKYLDKFENTLLKVMLWSTLHHMTRDAKMKGSEFLKLVREKLPVETDGKLTSSIISYAAGVLEYYTPDSTHETEADKMFDVSLEMLRNTKNPDIRISLGRQISRYAESKEKIQILLNMLDNGTKIEGFEFDQAMRWGIILQAAAHGVSDSITRVESELKRDPSDRGQREALTARAALPEAKAKAEAWEKILTDKESSYHEIRAIMRGFRFRHQKELLRPYDQKFFEVVQEVFKTRDREHTISFITSLFPFIPEDDNIIARTEQFAKTLDPDHEQIILRNIKEKLDDLRRSRAVVTLEKSGGSKL